MTSVLNAIVKLPRFVKIRSTNGDEDNERPYDRYKEYYLSYYNKNRNWILEKKKIYNKLPHVKQHNAQRHHRWYLEHKQELNHKRREKKKNKIK